jgi:8-oxo-dGTP pyrophosphatase MutT (NUDIX family)
MPFEKSAGSVIFRKDGGKIFYLLLHYRSTEGAYWDFSKGHVEKGEKGLETAKREAKEETGLTDLKFIDDFKEWIKYFFKNKGKIIFKIVTFYLAESKIKDVKLSFEHTDFKWLPYEEAIQELGFKNAKEILKKAHNYLTKKYV